MRIQLKVFLTASLVLMIDGMHLASSFSVQYRSYTNVQPGETGVISGTITYTTLPVSDTTTQLSLNTPAVDTAARTCFSEYGCERIFYLFNNVFGTWQPNPGYSANHVLKFQQQFCSGLSGGSEGDWSSCANCMQQLGTMLGDEGPPIMSVKESLSLSEDFCDSTGNDVSGTLNTLLENWRPFAVDWGYIALQEDSSLLLPSLSTASAISNPEGSSYSLMNSGTHFTIKSLVPVTSSPLSLPDQNTMTSTGGSTSIPSRTTSTLSPPSKVSNKPIPKITQSSYGAAIAATMLEKKLTALVVSVVLLCLTL